VLPLAYFQERIMYDTQNVYLNNVNFVVNFKTLCLVFVQFGLRI